MDAHEEKEEEEDEEVFLEAIQTEERERERESYLPSSFGNDESTWCVTDRERPALPSLSSPARDVCRGTLHRRRRCRSRREYLSKTPMIIFQKEEGERERKQEQTRGEGGGQGERGRERPRSRESLGSEAKVGGKSTYALAAPSVCLLYIQDNGSPAAAPRWGMFELLRWNAGR